MRLVSDRTARRIRCPNCGESDLDAFIGELPTEGTWTFLLVAQDDDGTLVAEGMQHASDPKLTKVEVFCTTCKHSWRTTHDWRLP